MSNSRLSRRSMMKAAGTLAGGSLLAGCGRQPAMSAAKEGGVQPGGPADYTLTIAVKPVELAPNRIISTTTYNGQFPGPLLRFKEGQQVTIDIHNQTDTPEQLHWHGQFLSTDVDGAAEEGTPFIPAHGSRRITFVPKPSGLSLLPHARPRGSESERGTVHRAGRSGLYRTEEQSRQLRSRSLPHAEGIRTDVQPRRRHGHGFSVARDDGKRTERFRARPP